MPSTKRLQPIEASQRSILSLDKSSAPFPVQIQEACEFLGITLPGGPDSVKLQYQIHGGDPRIDWALRWLLKNFQSAKLDVGSSCLDAQAWLLLSQLVVRTPLTTTSRLLNTFKFPVILANTLQWLQEYVLTQAVSAAGRQMSSNIRGSSSDTLSPALAERRSASRKRKRDEESISSTLLEIQDIRRLYGCIYSNLDLLLDLTNDASAAAQGFAVEHLRAALTAAPDHAAQTLGSALAITTFILLSQANDRGKSGKEVSLSLSLPVIIKFWRHSSCAAKDSSHIALQQCFSQHCLLPTLRLLQHLDGLASPSEGCKDIMQALEGLLRTQIVLPARLAFLNAAKPRDNRDPNIPDSFLDDLLAPVTAMNISDTLPEISVQAVVIFYRIAIECRPRNIPKERRIEHSWLQKLFVYIAKASPYFESSDVAFDSQGGSTTILCEMLQLAVYYDVAFDSLLLGWILKRLFEIFDICVGTHWEIVRLCMVMDPFIFVHGAVARMSGSKESTNELLPLLSENFRKHADALYHNDFPIGIGQGIAITDQDADVTYISTLARHGTTLKSIAILLARAFAKSRALPIFFTYWQVQLSACQHSEFAWNVSVWEDDELQQVVQELVEPSLVAEQVEKLLSHMMDEIEKVAGHEPKELSNLRACISRLIILECFLSGCTTHATIEKVQKKVSSIYDQALHLPIVESSLKRDHKRLVWRLMATINGRWPLREGNPKLSFDAATEAFTIITKTSEDLQEVQEGLGASAKAAIARTIYGEKFQAFRFILSFASMQALNSRLIVGNAIHTEMMDWIGRIIYRFVRPTTEALHSDKDSSIKWSGRSEPTTEEDLVIALLTMIAHCPPILHCLTQDIQSCIFRDTYNYAFKDALALSVVESGRNSFHDVAERQSYEAIWMGWKNRSSFSRWLWIKLASEMWVHESIDVRTRFCDFQVSKFLQHSRKYRENFDPSRFSVIDTDRATGSDVAFELLQSTPITSFSKVQRTDIANRILQHLLNREYDVETVAGVMHVLTSLVRMPSSTMVILKQAALGPDSDDGEVIESCSTHMLSVAKWLDILALEGNIPFSAVTKLDLLTSIVIEYTISHLPRRASIEYLRKVHQDLRTTLGRKLSIESDAVTSAIIGSILRPYWQHPNATLDFSQQWLRNNKDLRQLHFRELCRNLESVPSEGPNGMNIPELQQRLIIWLRTVTLYEDLLINSENMTAVFNRIITIYGAVRATPDVESSAELDLMDQFILRIRRQVESQFMGDMDYLEAIKDERQNLRSGDSTVGRKQKLRAFQKWVASLGSVGITEMANTLVNHSVDNTRISYETMLLLEAIVAAVIAKSTPTDEMQPLLSRIFGLGGEQLITLSSSEVSIVAIRCMNLVLRSKTRMVTQHHFDSLLGSITVAASKLNCARDTKHAGTLYLGLCKLLAAALILHRKKLGGRYHLLIRALKSLLQPLFTPYTTPEVMVSSKAASASLLNKDHAAAYARLLSSLCDPTVSSVSRSKHSSREELNDETQKARSIAGQHIQYFIEEYCECHLKGKLPPEMKAAITPGINAAFAVMPQEVMRNLNAAMRSSSQSIFKALYDEYKRIGRGTRI